jgi:murein DD-endopeptidase MepM/ murein hydrolase activator NlpD
LLTGAEAIASEVPLRLDGEIAQGHLVVGHTDPAARVRFAGDPVRVSPDGVFLIGFGRDAPETQRLVVELPDGPRVTRTLEIARRDYAIQRIDGVPPETVNPPESALPRIEREVEMVRTARERDEARTDFLADFQWPLEGEITGVYGSQRVYNGEPRRPHYGIDIAAPKGAPVRAPAPGRVTLTDTDMYFSGGTLILDHGHGLSTTFLHLSAITADDGERVEQGQVIGRVGASGRATGPHLDWRINLFQRRLDPATLVGPMPE